MTASLFQYCMWSPITSSLKRKLMNLLAVKKQTLSNLKNLFVVVKTNTIRSQHMFLSIEQFSFLIRRPFDVT